MNTVDEVRAACVGAGMTELVFRSGLHGAWEWPGVDVRASEQPSGLSIGVFGHGSSGLRDKFRSHSHLSGGVTAGELLAFVGACRRDLAVAS